MPLSTDLRSCKRKYSQEAEEFGRAAGEAIRYIHNDTANHYVLGYILGRVEARAQESWANEATVLRAVICGFLDLPDDPDWQANALERTEKLVADKLKDQAEDNKTGGTGLKSVDPA